MYSNTKNTLKSNRNYTLSNMKVLASRKQYSALTKNLTITRKLFISFP